MIFRAFNGSHAFGALVAIAIASLAGLFANALFGNPVVGLAAAVIVGMIGFFAMRAGPGWLHVVGISLLVLIVAAMFYAAFVFWWNYG